MMIECKVNVSQATCFHYSGIFNGFALFLPTIRPHCYLWHNSLIISTEVQ